MAKNKKSLPSSLIVTQSNTLVEGRYNLPLGEQRLILTMISKIQPDDEDFKPYSISINEFSEFLDIDKNHVYAECKKITEKLLTRVVSIEEPDGLLQIGWLSSAKYIDGYGMVNLSFDPLLKPYLVQLKSNFTSCKLHMLLSFKSQYTIRIYNILKQYERLKEREIELEQLRDMLGISRNQHVEYSNFKNNILRTTQKELKNKSDLYFEFDEIKHGRRVGSIRFRILSQKKLIEPSQDKDKDKDTVNVMPSTPRLSVPVAQKDPLLDKLLSLVPEQHKAKKTVQAALEDFEKKHGVDYVKRNILYSNAKADKSYAGFLNSALKADWGHDWQLDQQEVVKKNVMEVWERQGFSTQKEYDDFMYRKQMEAYGKSI